MPSTHVGYVECAELAGTKTVAETVPAGWTLTKVVCTNTVETREGDAVSFSVAAGAQIVCTFTNVKDATVRYTKVTDPASDPQDFVFGTTGSGLTGDTLDTDPASAGMPSTHVDTLDASELAGTKTVAETVPAGWTLTTVDCTNTVETREGDAVSFSVAAGAQIVCTFTNVKDATVRYTKVTDPASDPQDFVFGTTGSGLTGDTLDTDPASAGMPSTHVDTLDASELAGTKTVAETVPAGWTLTTVDCTNTVETREGDAVSFSVAAGAQIVCTFTNVKDASVRYTKVTDPASDPQDFVFGTTGSGLTGDTLDTDPASAGMPSTHVDTLDARVGRGRRRSLRRCRLVGL